MRAASTLVEAGCVVTLIDRVSEHSSPPGEKTSGISIQHIIVQRRSTGWIADIKHLLQAPIGWLMSVKRLLQTPADLYHASGLRALPACYIAAASHRKPLVFEAYEQPFATFATGGLCKRWLCKLFVCFLKGILWQCAGVIAVSPLDVQEYRREYSLPDVVLLRDVPAYRPAHKDKCLRKCLGLHTEMRIAFYAGALRSEYELENLVRAAAFLERDIVLVLMKRGPCEMIARMEQLIEGEGMLERVKLLEPVPREELLDWISSADLGLLVLPPTYMPGAASVQPAMFFDYLIAGLPVLTSQLEAVVEIVASYDAGRVVAALTPEDIGAAINALLADSEALAWMRDNALRAAREFCWERERQKLVTLYRDILCERFVELN